jgi:peptide/nickel transport system permease protein
VKRITQKSIRKNAGRIVGWLIIAIFVCVALFADFLSPYDYREQSRGEPSAPASGIYFRPGPAIYTRRLTDPLRLQYTEDHSRIFPVEFFVRGYSYKALGLVQTDLHLFGIAQADSAPRINLLGTDALGRDRFSRLTHAVRFSLIVCSIGVVLACLIGVFIGIVSGYASRLLDTILMGATDAMLALPTLILILAARAA